MTRWLSVLVVLPVVLTLASGRAMADVDPYAQVDLTPSHDTWATHDDGLVHGLEEIIRVGIEPRACVPDGDPGCDTGEECCIDAAAYNYCAPTGQCATTTPSWTSYRKFRGYLRFDLSSVPEGRIESAYLNFKLARTVELMGGAADVEVFRLSSIGEGNVCAWNEATLNDTNYTRWSSLPQNISLTPDGRWRFDVTKAVRDWLTGDSDFDDLPIRDNCGFHLADGRFGNAERPLARWVEFSSKEGAVAPLLSIRVALDVDDDGYPADCDEEDPDRNPGATEACDGVDNDCDGATDEENCDGIDNDCDGVTDEGDPLALCGPGKLCVAHACVDVCEDECANAYDTTCKQGEDGVWQRWACGDVDDDPCRERYYAADCEPDEFCQFGSCSNNCVDLCEPEENGVTDCWRDDLGNEYVATCGDWDDDGCLEWGQLNACAPSGTCTAGVCEGGCSDGCLAFGAAECVDEQTVRMCYDSDDDGCLEWTETETCAGPDAVCRSGSCEPLVVCQDACTAAATRCEDAGGAAPATLHTCILRDDAPCYDWDAGVACVYGCDDSGVGCADAPPAELDPLPDVVGPGADTAAPDAAGSDVVEPDAVGPGADTVAPDAGADVPAPPRDEGSAPGDDTAVPPDAPASPDAGGAGGDGLVLDIAPVTGDTGGSGGSGGSGGCQSGGNTPPGAPVLLLLLLFVLALRRRTTDIRS